MTARRTRTVNGTRYVLIEERELKRLERRASQAEREPALPEYPPADEEGNRPAVEFARVSIARKIIEDRRAAGLTQTELADLAGVRQETVCRIERGRHSPTIRTVEKLDRVLQEALRKQAKPKRTAKKRK